MINLISRFFSGRYVNHKAIGKNLVLLWIYRLAYPIAHILNALKFTPNQITVLSTIAALFAAVVLIQGFDAWVFCFFWGLSVILDFCDGTVARISNRKPKSAFRFDHNSDLAKISVILIATGWHEADPLIWLLVCSALFCFLYYSTVSEELRVARMRILDHTKKRSGETQNGNLRKTMKNFFKMLYEVLFTINGHTLLIFFLIPYGFKSIVSALGYLILVCCLGSFNRIRILLSLPRGDAR